MKSFREIVGQLALEYGVVENTREKIRGFRYLLNAAPQKGFEKSTALSMLSDCKTICDMENALEEIISAMHDEDCLIAFNKMFDYVCERMTADMARGSPSYETTRGAIYGYLLTDVFVAYKREDAEKMPMTNEGTFKRCMECHILNYGAVRNENAEYNDCEFLYPVKLKQVFDKAYMLDVLRNRDTVQKMAQCLTQAKKKMEKRAIRNAKEAMRTYVYGELLKSANGVFKDTEGLVGKVSDYIDNNVLFTTTEDSGELPLL